MKIRTGFVSNSSGSSFLIPKEHLTDDQLVAIRSHLEAGAIFNTELKLDSFTAFCTSPGDVWHIRETKTKIEGSHYIDNFDMEQFLKFIGVDSSHVEFFDKEAAWDDWSADDNPWTQQAYNFVEEE